MFSDVKIYGVGNRSSLYCVRTGVFKRLPCNLQKPVLTNRGAQTNTQENNVTVQTDRSFVCIVPICHYQEHSQTNPLLSATQETRLTLTDIILSFTTGFDSAIPTIKLKKRSKTYFCISQKYIVHIITLSLERMLERI